MGNILGCLSIIGLFGVPVWLQVNGSSPLWLILLAFIYNIFHLPPDIRANLHARAKRIHGDDAGWVVYSKPMFAALWTSSVVYFVTLVVRRWLL